MSDIVETLRAAANHPRNDHGPSNWLAEAADEITALRAEVARLEAREAELVAALKPFADEAAAYDPDEGDSMQIAWVTVFTIGAVRRARAAIAKVEGGRDDLA